MWWRECRQLGSVALLGSVMLLGVLSGGCDPKAQKHPRPSTTPSARPLAEGHDPPKRDEALSLEEERPDAKPSSSDDGTNNRGAQKDSDSKDRGPLSTVAKRSYVVAALGDSLTDANSGGGGYLRVLEEACPLSRFVNFGKGGDMTNQMRRRLHRDILPQVEALQIDTLLVYGGVNDLYSDRTAGRTNAKIESDLAAIYAAARKEGLRVIAVTVSPWSGFKKYWNERRGQNTQLLNSWILGQVERGEVDRAVDSYAILSCGDSQALCPLYQNRSPDGLHLGPTGHRKLGEKLLQDAFSDCR